MTQTNDTLLLRRLKIFFCLLAAVMGAVHAWHNRHFMYPDGVCYLDIGDAYWRGDWNMAINAYWSPLYSWLLGLTMLVLRPSPYWEFTVVHLVNFLIYLGALGAFSFLLVQLLCYQRETATRASADRSVALPEWALLSLGYSFFIWYSLRLTTVRAVTPDMLMSVFLFLASGILMRIRRGFDNWLMFAVLGAVVGFGYLAKAVMFPIAFVFAALCLLSGLSLRTALPRALLASLIFIMVAGPFILAISHAKGRFTFGETAKLNYDWLVNRDIAPYAKAKKIFDVPAMYEFETSNTATFPGWYDPSRGHEVGPIRFDAKKQLSVLTDTASAYYELFFNAQADLLIGFLTLYLFGRRYSFRVKTLAAYGSLLIPAIAGLGMYSLILVISRFIGGFLVLLWVGIAAAVRMPDTQESRKLMDCVTILLLAMMTIRMAAFSAGAIYSTAHDLATRENSSTNVDWQITDALRRLGVRAGDKVASVGDSTDPYWARLLRVQIVAEIANGNEFYFWMTNPSVKAQVTRALAGTGAKVIVTRNIPHYFSKDGWQKIGDTDHYVYLLPTS